jgi:type II secretory pathway pseudopilin PulG
MTAGKKQQGFTYLALLLVVAAAGALLAATGEIASHSAQREKEADLLFAGDQYRAAIRSYYEGSPGGAKIYPRKLEDLLKDSRVPATLRHLRRLYADPVTGSAQWGLVEAPQGGIMGVYSLSEEAPIKTGGFSKANEAFADSVKYSDWKFTYAPAAPAVTPAAVRPAAVTPASPNGLSASR